MSGTWNAVTRELIAVTNTTVVNTETMSELLRKIAALGLTGPITAEFGNSTVSRPCTPELISSELLAFSTVSGISEPRRHRNDDLKPLKAWKKRGSHASAEKTDRSKVSSSPKRLGFIGAIAQMT